MNTHNILRALSDPFMPVRDPQGRLLGCIPKPPDTAEALRGSNGSLYIIGGVLQSCIMADPNDPSLSPRFLDGFIPLDADTGTPTAPSRADGEDPDLAIGV